MTLCYYNLVRGLFMTYCIEFDDGGFYHMESTYVKTLDYAKSISDGRSFTIFAYFEGDFYEVEA